MKAILVSVSRKAKRINTWSDVYVDPYTSDDQEFIKVFVTKHDLENKHFNLNKILIDDESYQVVEKTFEVKRPKYAICKVTK